jgi:hypothetical protein
MLHKLTTKSMVWSKEAVVVGDECLVTNSNNHWQQGTVKFAEPQPSLDARFLPDTPKRLGALQRFGSIVTITFVAIIGELSQ